MTKKTTEAYRQLLQLYQDNTNLTNEVLCQEIPRWLYLQEYSKRRTNIARWIDIDAGDSILEVGAGCGAVTRYLSEAAKMVLCVEYSPLKAEIHQKRFSNMENVRTFCDEHELQNANPSFDKIFVWEVKAKTVDDFTQQLKTLMSMLKTNGTMYVGIDNRFALRRWAGYQDKKPFCISKSQLIYVINLMEEFDTHLYYPYPDYEYMMALYSDEHLPMQGELTENVVPAVEEYRAYFDEADLFDEVIQNGEFSHYANSYLLSFVKR